MRAAIVVTLAVAAACGGGLTAASPSPSASSAAPSPSASAPPSATASATARPTGTPIVLPSFAQVSAPSSNVIWMLVAGSRLFRSADRGDTWDERSLPAGRDPAISFVSDVDGYVAVTGSPGPCQARPGPIWHTTDGAATWREVTLAGVTAAVCSASLSFTDARHGYLAALDEKSGPTIVRTADGGATWTASGPLTDPPGLPMQGGRADMRIGRVRAFGTALLVSVTVPASTGPSSHVYRSTDGGATWTYATSIPNDGTFAMVTAVRWLRIGPPGASFESTDAGSTWHAYATDYSQAAPIPADFVFADASVGYATVRGGIQRTVDGGAHWVTLRTPGTS